MDTIQTSPRNIYTGAAADALLAAKRGANKYEVKDWVPLLGGTGLGDLFMGKAPELADDISYQGLSALHRGGNLATGGIGTYGLDPRTVDAAFLGADAYGLGKLGKYLAQRSGQKLLDGAHNVSRRDFLKKSTALGGTAALGGLGLGALRTIGRESGEVAAKAAGPQKYRFNSLKEYNDYLDEAADAEVSIARSEAGLPADYEPRGTLSGSPFETANWKRNIAVQDENMYNAAKEAAKNPNKLAPPPMEVNPVTGESVSHLNAFSPQAKAEMKAFKQQTADWINYLDMLNLPQ